MAPTLPLLLLLLLASPAAWGGGYGEEEKVVVEVQEGAVRGLRVFWLSGGVAYAFRGLPYARAPTGRRRFKDPEEAESWTGVRDATAFGPHCVQFRPATNVTGEEDCLYLNVLTADAPATWPGLRRPVMVKLHGGAFVVGDGDMLTTQPAPLLRRGIVFVSVNYRLGVMGFLNTEDAQAPGNAGLKDQAMALRWVQRNIEAFGGDPTQVTIIGESAGGASVHLHMLSPLSRGLFQRAIAMSGTALPTWTHVQRPRENALALRSIFASSCEDKDDIVSCLQRIPAEELVTNEYNVPLQQFQNYFLKGTFLPSAETPSSGAAPFLPAPPEQLLNEGNFSREVPFMTGFTSGDGIIFMEFADMLRNLSRWAEVDQNFEKIFKWEMPRGLRTKQVARQVRSFYLGNRTLSDANENLDTMKLFVQLCTDVFFAAGAVLSARQMAALGARVFVYEFTREGPIAFTKQDLNATRLPGVVHGDDLPYIYDYTDAQGAALRSVPDAEQGIRRRQAHLFANMAATGSPTPEGSGLAAHWPPYSLADGSYAEMDQQLTARARALGERIAFWRGLYENRTAFD